MIEEIAGDASAQPAPVDAGRTHGFGAAEENTPEPLHLCAISAQREHWLEGDTHHTAHLDRGRRRRTS